MVKAKLDNLKCTKVLRSIFSPSSIILYFCLIKKVLIYIYQQCFNTFISNAPTNQRKVYILLEVNILDDGVLI